MLLQLLRQCATSSMLWLLSLHLLQPWLVRRGGNWISSWLQSVCLQQWLDKIVSDKIALRVFLFVWFGLIWFCFCEGNARDLGGTCRVYCERDSGREHGHNVPLAQSWQRSAVQRDSSGTPLSSLTTTDKKQRRDLLYFILFFWLCFFCPSQRHISFPGGNVDREDSDVTMSRWSGAAMIGLIRDCLRTPSDGG